MPGTKTSAAASQHLLTWCLSRNWVLGHCRRICLFFPDPKAKILLPVKMLDDAPSPAGTLILSTRTEEPLFLLSIKMVFYWKSSSEALGNVSALAPELRKVARPEKVFIYRNLEVSSYGSIVTEDCAFVNYSSWHSSMGWGLFLPDNANV